MFSNAISKTEIKKDMIVYEISCYNHFFNSMRSINSKHPESNNNGTMDRYRMAKLKITAAGKKVIRATYADSNTNRNVNIYVNGRNAHWYATDENKAMALLEEMRMADEHKLESFEIVTHEIYF